MNARKRLLSIFVIVIGAYFLFSEISNFLQALEKEKKDNYAHNLVNLNTVLDLQKKNTQLLSMLLANDDVVKHAYTQNNPELLIEHLLPFWKKVKEKELVYEIHFFKPPAISFVNFSNFDSVGEDASKVRKDIAWITSSFKNSSHLMMCKTYAGIRATYPIVDADGKMLGGISLGKKVDWLPGILKNMTQKDAFLVYTDQSAQSLAGRYYEKFLENKSKFGEYILAEKTMAVSPKDLKDLDFASPIQDIKIGAKKYSLNLFPLFDFEHKVMAYVMVLNDYEAFYWNFYVRLAKSVFVLLALLVLLQLFIRQNSYKYLKRISSLQSLAHAFKAKDFSALGTKEKGDGFSCELAKGDEIDHLYRDILSMGVTLSDYYDKLEDQVDEKTAELKISNARLMNQLYIDSLTKLPSRYAFFQDLSRTASAQVAILNINRFKMINDVYGVLIGNELLVEIATFIRNKCEKIRIYHLGADEFALLGNSEFENSLFEQMIVELIRTIEEAVFVIGEQKTEMNIAVYAGISFENENSLEAADIALSKAKKAHLNYVVYDNKEQGAKTLNINNILLMQKIKNALSNGDMRVYYQAIVDVEGKVLKYEALVRMIDGDRVLTPYHFLEIAKKSKYYHEITRSVIKESFAKFKERDELFSININAEDIANEKTAKYILDSLMHFEKRSNVVFEIVESESIENLLSVQQFIKQVKNMGAKIAIDDFGSGYSNFSYLIDLHPDYIKIDGSLIRNVHEDENALNIVKMIVEFAKILKVKTIAEFVHSKEVFDIVKALGVDEFQGYYFAEPSAEI